MTAKAKGVRDKLGQERALQKWDDSGWDGTVLEGSLEDQVSKSGNGLNKNVKIDPNWDQFQINEALFGVRSTFKEDLSQYTTPLNVKAVPEEVKQRAKMIAADIEKNGWGSGATKDGDMGGCYDEAQEAWAQEGQLDEEDLFSSVPRGAAGYGPHNQGGGNDGGLGGALLATLMAGGGAVSNGSPSSGSGHRSLITPKVHEWWRARRQSGLDVPAGCEDALVCPFSQRVFGDVSQLVTHWAAALPRAVSAEGESTTPCTVATEEFRRISAKLTTGEVVSTYGLEALLPLTANTKSGTAWGQIVAKIEARGKSNSSPPPPIRERPATDLVSEAVGMRCWQRNMKVEHREVLEGIAAGLALHILEDKSGTAWSPQATAR